MRKREEENWNSESTPSKVESQVRRTGTIRKLKEIDQALDLMTTHNDPTNPPKKTENEEKLNGLLEDIRCALMDYQVCTPRDSLSMSMYLTSASDFIATRNLR